MADKYKLYSLNDETGIRYIGITKQPLSCRLSGHISSCKQAFKKRKSMHHRHCWIYSLLNKNLKPTIHLLGTYNSQEAIQNAEIMQIAHCKIMGIKLVNSTIGGDGVREYKFTEEHLEKLRLKVDQYTIDGLLLNTYKSLSEASKAVTGSIKNNNKISGVTRGKYGKRTAFGYVWRIYGDAFDKYPVLPQINITDSQKKALSKRQLENNVMKGKFGSNNPGSKTIVITNANNVIVNILGSIIEVIESLPLSKSMIYKMLSTNKEVNNYKLFYANKDIVQSLQKCKSSTLKTFVGQQYKF
jgi:hypothetical protein